MRHQPLLAVLRPDSLEQAHLQLEQLQGQGLFHVELAVQLSAQWVDMVRRLRGDFPGLRLGAASVRCADGLEASLAAGLGYAVSPILDRALLQQAAAASITLVPGVFSPTEIVAALNWGAPAVKLFPAAVLGPAYWSALAGPLGPLPFCIAAGGLSAATAPSWFTAGVDAVALGGSLFDQSPEGPRLQPGVSDLLAWLPTRSRTA